MEVAKITPVKPTISIDLLNGIDIRVGTVELVEDIHRSEIPVGLKWIPSATLKQSSEKPKK